MADYFKSSTEISKGMKVIDDKLGGTTILDVTLDFDNKKLDNTEVEKTTDDLDDFDDLLLELKEKVTKRSIGLLSIR